MRPEENILFKGNSDYDCHRMLKCFNTDIKSFRSGARIADYSEENEKIGIILSGCVLIEKYDRNGIRTIAESLNENRIFGLFFTFNPSMHSNIEAVAGTDCEIMFIRRSEITKRCEKACECHSRVVENLLALMSKEAIALSEHIEVLSQRSIEDKVISCLSIIEKNTPDGQTPELPFSMTMLSDYLCVNRSALQRVISKLKNDGILLISKRKFHIVRNVENDN